MGLSTSLQGENYERVFYVVSFSWVLTTRATGYTGASVFYVDSFLGGLTSHCTDKGTPTSFYVDSSLVGIHLYHPMRAATCGFMLILFLGYLQLQP